MPPRKRQSDAQIEVDPPEAALPRAPRKATATKAGIQAALEQSAARLAAQQEPPTDVHTRSTTPTKAAVAAAVEQSAENLAAQQEPPSDVHLRPTTPTKAAVEEAVARSAEHLEGQGVIPSRIAATAPRAAAPVSAGLANPALAAAPVSDGRDRSRDAAPVFSAPVRDKPSED